MNFATINKLNTIYRMEGNVGEFGKSSVIHQTKTIQISNYN